MRKVIREAHNKGKTNIMHSVEVSGVAYRSVWAAWQTLQIEGKDHQAFRLRLKRSKTGALTYTDRSTGKTHAFRLIPYNAKL